MNGRSFQTLIGLAAGIVFAPSGVANQGQFSVNGQRTGSNYFTVDGVSANFGVGHSATLYEGAGGGIPSFSAQGGTLVATARGATKWRVLVRYALPNALLRFLTVVGVGIGSLLGGAAIIEAVFTYPGVGSYVVEAVRARDLPVIQGFVIISVLTYITANFLVDVAALLVDPRLRTKATR